MNIKYDILHLPLNSFTLRHILMLSDKFLFSTVVLLWVGVNELIEFDQATFTFHCGSIMGSTGIVIRD